jgi:hypothetical protein
VEAFMNSLLSCKWTLCSRKPFWSISLNTD